MPATSARPARDEESRLDALRELRVLDTPQETVYDDIVLLASEICRTPIGLVSLVDRDRQWFKARIGLDATETPRDLAFCAHTIVCGDPLLIVEDATLDPRFADNALVTGAPHIRFYAGAPIAMPNGHVLGTVCVIDTEPRKLDAAQRIALQALARQTTALLELRERAQQVERHARELERISAESARERARAAELLELVLRGGNLGMWDLHVPSGRFATNVREHEMLGYNADAARPEALDWQSLMHPDDWPPLKAAIGRHLAGHSAYYECEHRMRHRDGHWIWVLDHAVVVERDEHGGPLRIVGTHMDITSRVSNRHALQRARNLLQRMGTLAKVGGWEFDRASGRIHWTDEVYRIHDLEPGTDIDLAKGLDHYPPAVRATIGAAVEAALADGTAYDLELPFVSAEGRALMVRAQGEPVRADGGEITGLFGTFQDITERKAAEQAIVAGQRRLRLITDNLPALVAQIDNDERYCFLNAHVERAHGIDVATALGRTMREVRSQALYAKLAPHVQRALAGERQAFVYDDEVDGRTVHFQSNYVPDVDADGHVHGFYAMTFDISELKRTQGQLEQLARVDALTGLPNRRQFDERIGESMARARRLRQRMALMFLDVDRFKTINDSLGHAAGDAVLCEFARRLKGCVRATDLVARLAGDEFVVLLESIDGAAQLDRLAAKIVECIRPRFELAGQTALDVTTSAGVATYDGSEVAPAEILARADAALYRAKQNGRNGYALA